MTPGSRTCRVAAQQGHPQHPADAAELSNGPTRKWPSDRRMMMCGASGQSPYRPDADKAAEKAPGGRLSAAILISVIISIQLRPAQPSTSGHPCAGPSAPPSAIRSNGVTGRAFRQPPMPTGATSGSSPSAARCRDSGRRVDGRRHGRQEICAHLIAQRRNLARDVFLLQRTQKLQELGCTCSKTRQQTTVKGMT